MFNNNKIKDLEYRVKSAERQLLALQFEMNNPPKYKIGDKYDKDNIVNSIYKQPLYSDSNYDTVLGYEWKYVCTNIKTGLTTYNK